MATNIHMYICTDVSGLRLILVLTRALVESTDVRVRVHYSVQSAMRNAVQKKIKNLEETQLQKLDSTRVESSTVCMTLTQLPGPPPSPSLRSRRHLNSRRTAQPGRAACSPSKHVHVHFSPNSAFAVCTLCQKQSFRKFSTYVNLSCKMLVLIVYVRTDKYEPHWAKLGSSSSSSRRRALQRVHPGMHTSGPGDRDGYACCTAYTVYSTCSMYRVPGNGTARTLGHCYDAMRLDRATPHSPDSLWTIFILGKAMHVF